MKDQNKSPTNWFSIIIIVGVIFVLINIIMTINGMSPFAFIAAPSSY